jgi:hypothetical protein
MRTFLIIVAGLTMLGGSVLTVGWIGTGWRTPFADVGKLFIPIWFCLSALNLWIGVKQAGYSIDEEFTNLFVDLHHSCKHGCALVVAILRVVAGFSAASTKHALRSEIMSNTNRRAV